MTGMHFRSPLLVLALAAALGASVSGARAFDETKYPDLKGQWDRIGNPRWDPGRTNASVPLTAEYRAIYEANVKRQEAGEQGDDPTYNCLAPGMPRVMNLYEPMEIVVTADTTYMLIDHIHDNRRIYTDGRDWPPADREATFEGYSIGKWVDERGDGRYDALLVETRNLKGPRTYDTSGLPFHKDNQTIIKERISLDKADLDVLHDEITTMDHALTRPWTVTKSYRRVAAKEPIWRETICAEFNQHVKIGDEDYFLGADGLLMPVKKGQSPPDLKYFKQTQK